MSRWYLVFLLIFIFLVHSFSLNFPFLSDDVTGIAENINLTNFSESLNLNKLGFVFVLIRYMTAIVSGQSPILYRLVNILFHLGSVLMVYKIFRKNGEWRALSISGLFGLHPLTVESITWISGAPYSIMGFFALLTYYLYTHTSKVKYFWSLVTFVCAISVNILATSLIPILIIRNFLTPANKDKKIILVFMTILSVLFAYLMITKASSRQQLIEVDTGQQVDTKNPLISIPIAISKYTFLYYFPEKLSLYQSELSTGFLGFGLGLLITISIVAFAIFLIYRKKETGFWLAWSVLALGVTLIPTGLTWVVAERYSYLSLVGISVITVNLLERIFYRKINKDYLYLLVFLLGLALVLRTGFRISDWRSNEALWTATAKTSPSSPHTHLNLGYVYNLKGDYNKAIKLFDLSLSINPNNAATWFHKGESLRMLGKYQNAVEMYKKCLELNPTIWQAARSMAVTFIAMDDKKKALESFNLAKKYAPTNDQGMLLIEKMLK